MQRRRDTGTGPANWAAAILAATVFLAAALGSPVEELLQDTVKSAIVAAGALLALFSLFRAGHARELRFLTHWSFLLPVALATYASASVLWSHAYLASVEAIRWGIIAVIWIVSANVLTRKELPLIAAGVTAGATIAAGWAVLQFTAGFELFVQGPGPGSTFFNRNFFAEFAVASVPFIAANLLGQRDTKRALLLTSALALVVVAVAMTGARGALIALGVELLVGGLAAWRQRANLRLWSLGVAPRAYCAVLGLAIIGGLGSVPTKDPRIAAEGRGLTAIERTFSRTSTIGTLDGSLAIRAQMWTASIRMFAAHPLAGVGAGAWENEVPLYQPGDSLIEIDYYAHNEYLQLVAEYGLVGVVFIVGLLAWLARLALRVPNFADGKDQIWCIALLISAGGFLIVSCVGFPWHLAATDALLALTMGALAGAEARSRSEQEHRAFITIRPAFAAVGCVASACMLALAVQLSARAWVAERNIVAASRLAMAIAASQDPNSARWDPSKKALLAMLRRGIEANPHYRRITPAAAEAMAQWGDWQDAIWVWESVLASRPNVVAILYDLAKAYAHTGNDAKAAEYMARALAVWHSPSRS